jgi:hypothetical protein
MVSNASSGVLARTQLFYPHFVPEGVYLRTQTGELIGRLDKPGAPFPTLEEAREKADWLEDLLRQLAERRGER